GGRRVAVQFRQQQTGVVHVVAGDVGVNVDGARHHDLAGRVVAVIGTGAVGRRSDDAAVTNPDVTNAISAIGRVNDATTFDPCQHGHAPADGRATAICAMASATDSLPLCCEAGTAISVPVAGQCSTASWSVPGRPTSM